MYRIVVVDDEKFIRERLCSYVNELPGMEVVAECRHGQAVIDYLKQHIVDVVITDIKMPVMDGLELASWISSNVPECQVVLVSAYEEFEYARQAMEYGVKSYLVKPIRKENLCRILEALKVERAEYERKNLYLQNMQIDEKERILTTWRKDSSTDISDALNGLSGCLYVFEETMDSIQSPDVLLKIALKNILKWSAQRSHVVYMGKRGWSFRYAVLFEKEEFAPDLDVVEHRAARLLDHPIKVTRMGSFSTQDELYMLQEGKTNNDDVIIQQVEAFVLAHMSEPIGRDEVAKAVYLESSYFSKYFKSKAGINFKHYLFQMRMEKAKRLLKKGISVKETCKTVGYQDVTYFGKLFKEYTGYSPKEYRSVKE